MSKTMDIISVAYFPRAGSESDFEPDVLIFTDMHDAQRDVVEALIQYFRRSEKPDAVWLMKTLLDTQPLLAFDVADTLLYHCNEIDFDYRMGETSIATSVRQKEEVSAV